MNQNINQREQPAAALMRLVNGYQVTQAIHVAATLGIADLLKEGPRHSADLAAATGTHARSLYRLLRALASVGVLHEESDGRFSLTPMGDCLRSDAPEPVGPWATLVGQEYYRQAWGNLLQSVRTGENAFRHVHGMSVWEYRTHHAEDSVIFDHAMTALSRQVSDAVVATYDFGRFRCVVDVGGGRGALLATILAKHPDVRGVLFDQPHVVAGATSLLEEAGVADRCAIVGGSFFDSIPTGGDAYVLKAILHDWEDEACIAILRNCRRVIPSDGRLLVVEQEVGPPNEGPVAKFSDLNMMVMPGGMERTRDEFSALFTAAGFTMTAVIPTGTRSSIIEGVPD